MPVPEIWIPAVVEDDPEMESLVKKTITETHEEDSNTIQTTYPYTYKSWPYEITCDSTSTATNPAIEKATLTMG